MRHYNDILTSLKECSNEIEKLRRDNQILFIENRAYDRILSAIESHRPVEHRSVESIDNAYVARKLARTIEKEQSEFEGKVKI